MKKTIFTFVFLGFLMIGVTLQGQNTPGFKIIVNVSNPLAVIAKDQLSKLFLKKTTKWENGTKALPLDQNEASSVRERFSKGVHNKGVTSVKSYWQKLIFSGRAVPPPVKSSDKEVVEYVKANPGAVGYVSEKASDNDVKVLKIKE